MRRLVRVLLVALLLLVILAMFGACAPGRQSLRPDRPEIAVRIPPAEAVDIRLHEERVPEPPRSPPFSVSDESAGRWLTLFDIDVTPSGASGIPPAPAESP